MKICKLCESAQADKRNSHIIPKFLTKDLFEFLPHRHAVEFTPKGSQKIQDTPKEDHLFCSSCEARFSIIETLFARKIKRMYSFWLYPAEFKKQSFVDKEYLNWSINPIQFSLFIYTIIWRCSISNTESFEKFNLPLKYEQSIRKYLDKNLRRHPESLEQIQKPDEIITDVICIMKPKEVNENNRGIFTAYQCSSAGYCISLKNMMIMYYPDIKKSPLAHRFFNLHLSQTVLIPLATDQEWLALRESLLKKIR